MKLISYKLVLVCFALIFFGFRSDNSFSVKELVKNRWKIIYSENSISKEKIRVNDNYILYFKKTLLGKEMIIESTSCNVPIKWGHCIIGFGFHKLKEKKYNFGSFLYNSDHLIHSEVIKDTMLFNPNHRSIMIHNCGYFEVKNDSLIMTFNECSGAYSGWQRLYAIKMKK